MLLKNSGASQNVCAQAIMHHHIQASDGTPGLPDARTALSSNQQMSGSLTACALQHGSSWHGVDVDSTSTPSWWLSWCIMCPAG
jgi:deoxyhypusine synthase